MSVFACLTLIPLSYGEIVFLNQCQRFVVKLSLSCAHHRNHCADKEHNISRKICPKDRRLASQSLPSDDKR